MMKILKRKYDIGILKKIKDCMLTLMPQNEVTTYKTL